MNTNLFDSETTRYGMVLHALGAGLLLLLFAGTYFLLYVPVHQEIAEVENDIQSLKWGLEEAPKVRGNYNTLKKRLAGVSGRMDRLRALVPKEPAISTFVANVNRMGEKVGVKISDYDSGSPIRRDGFEEIEITFTGTGSYRSICLFIQQVRDLPRLTKVTAIDLHSEVPGQKVYPFTFRTVIYYGLGSRLTKEKRNDG